MIKTKRKPERFVAISIRVPKRDLERIDIISRQTGLTRSALLRLAFNDGGNRLLDKFRIAA